MGKVKIVLSQILNLVLSFNSIGICLLMEIEYWCKFIAKKKGKQKYQKISRLCSSKLLRRKSGLPMKIGWSFRHFLKWQSINVFGHDFLLLLSLQILFYFWFYNAKRANKPLSDIHHCSIVFELSAIVRSAEQCHQLFLPKKFIPFFNYLSLNLNLPGALCKLGPNRSVVKSFTAHLLRTTYWFLSHCYRSILSCPTPDLTIKGHIKVLWVVSQSDDEEIKFSSLLSNQVTILHAYTGSSRQLVHKQADN